MTGNLSTWNENNKPVGDDSNLISATNSVEISF